MTDETFAIREEIARTRSEMTATLERIETRLDPRRLEEKAKNAAYDATIGKVKTMASRTSNGIVDTIKDNPIPLALTALGIGWLVVSARAPQAQERVVNAIGDKTSDWKGQASELAQNAQTKVRDVAHQAQERGRQVESSMERTFNDNPIAIGLGVVAAGLLIGLAIPTTQKENDLLGETRDKLAHRAIGKVDELAHKAIDKTNDQLRAT
jgi:ElaB/YqjD/DUF883 family membrane-anchored ribosome-binding protein